MVAAARLNPPPTFNGKRDGFTALSWLVAVNRYFRLANIEDDDRTPHAITYLANPGPAQWFDGCGLADDCDFDDSFTPTFKEEFIPHDFASSCRRQLTTLRMTTDFTSYLVAFKELLNALLGNAADESAKDTIHDFAQDAYIDNCPIALRQLLQAHLVQDVNANLYTLFQFGEKMDRIYHFKPDTGSKSHHPTYLLIHNPSSSSSPPPSNPSLPPGTPMDLDHLQVQFNNMNKLLLNMNRQINHNNNSPRHPPTITNEEKTHLDSIGGCYRCRQVGHMSRNCPTYGNSSRQNNNRNNNSNSRNNSNRHPPTDRSNDNRPGRWVFQLTEDDSPESGKVPDAQDQSRT